jgi:hypothetical protein
MEETIHIFCVAANGAYLGTDNNVYPAGTWETLKAMEHPELDGLTIRDTDGRWDYYCIELSEMFSCNANGKIEAR